MKTKIILVIIFFSSICKSQILLEHSYTGSNGLYVVNLSISGYKYVVTDLINQNVKFYNLNHTLWKTVTMTIPTGNTILGVNCISETLFNTDALLELSYSYYQSTPTIFTTIIVNENGTVILTLPNCSGAYPTNTGSNGWKLIATLPNTSSDVYSLVGFMPTTVENNSNNRNDYISLPFPNPSTTTTRIDYQLPTGVKSGELVFYDLNGTIIKTFQVDNSFNTIEINNSDLNSGTYFYNLIVQNTFSTSRKMIIIR